MSIWHETGPPRAWYLRFADYVRSIGSINSLCYLSLFIYRRGSDNAFLLLCVNNIVLTTSSDSLSKHITFLLASEFSMKDLGLLHYFLGIATTRSPNGIYLPQSKCVADIMEHLYINRWLIIKNIQGL